MKFTKIFSERNDVEKDPDYHITPKDHDIEFIDVVGTLAAEPKTQVKLARDVPVTCKEYQLKKFEEFKFARCPGLLEYSRLGYIVPSWSPIRIKSNKAGTVSYDRSMEIDSDQLFKSLQFDRTIVEGSIANNTQNDLCVFKYPSPWRVRTKPGIALLILPAVYHNSILSDDVFCYPGIVHYESFVSLNCVLTPMRNCEIKIEVGEPLLHVIPFRIDSFSANFGYKNDYDYEPILDKHPFQFVKSWYQRFCRQKPFKFTLNKIENKKRNG